MRDKKKISYAWYALRRTLPPWSFDENLQELIQYLPRYGVDELIVKIDTEEFTHGQPPYDWVKNYQSSLFRIKEAMTKIGILFSLNPWITTGHCDRGRDARKQLPGLQTVVGHDGTECTCCACPLSSVWREHVAKVWRLYAETKPHIIWIEDDIRTFNHAPVRFGCFCKDHMNEFSRRVGKKISREELVAAMLKPGKPHPWRAIYLEMQAELMIDTVSFLAKVVHGVSPETNLGLMSSGPRIHALEGRRWKEFALAMADGRKIYSRPPMGNYNEDSLRGFYYSHDSIKLTRFCMPEGTIEQTEVENVPFTQYSKSAVFTFLEMAISFAYGSHGVTMNLFDHCGTPMQSEPVFGKIISEKKEFLNSLAERAQASGVYRGVRLLHHQNASYVKHVSEKADYYSLVEDGYEAMQAMESHGIPTTYEDSGIIVSTGQVLRAFSDLEITKMLGKGIFLDAAATRVLYERGFGRLIGVESIEKPVNIDLMGAFSAEEFFNEKFGGKEKCFLTLTIPHLGGRPSFSVLKPAKKAEIISSIVDPDARRIHPCMMAYENDIGGRVIVHGIDWASAYGVAFNHTFRRVQLQRTIKWLAREKIPVCVNGGVYPLAFRKDTEQFILLGLFNLSLDPWPYVEFEIECQSQIKKAEILMDDARWQRSSKISIKRKESCLIVKYHNAVPFEKPLFITLWWK